MRYKLICIDIDGTLLNDKKKLLPQVKDSIKKIANEGIKIALISGRMPAGVALIEKELDIQCIKACNAGAYIILNNQCISEKCLLPDTMTKVYKEIALKYNIPLWIFKENKWFVTDIDEYVKQEIEIIHYQPQVVDIKTLAEQWAIEKTGPNKLVIATIPQMIIEINEKIKANSLDIDIARSASTFLEIFPKGINKATALIAICNKLNIALEDTIAIGDHELDIPMIEAAGVGVAMGNAIEKLKEKANFITKTNNEAGVAYAIEHYLME